MQPEGPRQQGYPFSHAPHSRLCPAIFCKAIQHVGSLLSSTPFRPRNEAKEKTKEKAKERRPVPRVGDPALPISFAAKAYSPSTPPSRPVAAASGGGLLGREGAEGRRGDGNASLHILANYLASLFRGRTFT